MIRSRCGAVAVCALAVAFCCGAESGGIDEDEPVAGVIDLEPVVVTARRSAASAGDVSENVGLLDASGIAMLPAERLSGVLEFLPGVDVEPRSVPGGSTSLSIQGCDSRQVRVMVEGIPLNSQSSGQFNPSVLPVSNIRQVEVIKGSGSSAWGSALGGVVNVLTKDTGTTAVPGGSFSSSVAGYATTRESGELYGRALGVGYYLMGEHMDSGGKGPRNDALENKFFNKLSYELPDTGAITALFGYSGNNADTKFPDGTWENQPNRLRYGKVGIADDFGGARVIAELKHTRQDMSTRSYDDISGDVLTSDVNTVDHLSELSLSASRTVRAGDTLTAGADLDYDTLKSDPYLSSAEHLFSAGPYINYTLNAGQWDFILGSRYDYNSEFGSDCSPSAGAVYHFEDAWSSLVRARVSRAFNAPPLLWKFYNPDTSHVYPNPDIHAERGIVYEAGAEASPLARLRLKLSLYRSDIRDALAMDAVSSGVRMMRNFEKFRRQGAGFEAKFRLTQELSLSGGAAFNDIEDRVTRKTVKGGGKARQSFDAGMEYAHPRGFSLSAAGYYKRWNQPWYYEANDRKFIFDLKAAQKAGKNVEFFMTVYNLTNSSYWSDNFYPIRGRYLETGVTISW